MNMLLKQLTKNYWTIFFLQAIKLMDFAHICSVIFHEITLIEITHRRLTKHVFQSGLVFKKGRKRNVSFYDAL